MTLRLYTLSVSAYLSGIVDTTALTYLGRPLSRGAFWSFPIEERVEGTSAVTHATIVNVETFESYDDMYLRTGLLGSDWDDQTNPQHFSYTAGVAPDTYTVHVSWAGTRQIVLDDGAYLFDETDNTVDFNSLKFEDWAATSLNGSGEGDDHVVLPKTQALEDEFGFKERFWTSDYPFSGGPGDDTLDATGAEEATYWELFGNEGNDSISGTFWVALGGPGNDTIDASAKPLGEPYSLNSSLVGGLGADLLIGSANADTIVPLGHDTVYTLYPRETLTEELPGVIDTVTAGAGADRIILDTAIVVTDMDYLDELLIPKDLGGDLLVFDRPYGLEVVVIDAVLTKYGSLSVLDFETKASAELHSTAKAWGLERLPVNYNADIGGLYPEALGYRLSADKKNSLLTASDIEARIRSIEMEHKLEVAAGLVRQQLFEAWRKEAVSETFIKPYAKKIADRIVEGIALALVDLDPGVAVRGVIAGKLVEKSIRFYNLVEFGVRAKDIFEKIFEGEYEGRPKDFVADLAVAVLTLLDKDLAAAGVELANIAINAVLDTVFEQVGLSLDAGLTRALTDIGSAKADTIDNRSDPHNHTYLTGDGADFVRDGIGSSIFIGGSGNGNDTYDGGGGRDQVVYDSARTELRIDLGVGTASGSSIGSDTLMSIEDARGGRGNDTIVGSHKANRLEGGPGKDEIQGGGGRDTIHGGLSADTLAGGSGADRFVFDTRLRGNIDTVEDFEHRRDKILLEDTIFTKVGSSLSKAEFYSAHGAASAHDASDRIIYDPSSGRLYFDDDGSKPEGHAPIHFATLVNKPVLEVGDFEIV